MSRLAIAAAVGTASLLLAPPAAGMSSAAMFDDFDGPAMSKPNGEFWSYDVGGWGLNGQLQTYSDSPDNVRLDGAGNLVIEAVKTPTGYTSGRLVTRDKVMMQYGTMSARIKMPAGKGISPSFWLLGADVDTLGWPNSGEIDVIEMPNKGNRFHSTLIGPWIEPPSTGKDYYSVRAEGPVVDMTERFHTFWISRLPNSVVTGMDDIVFGRFTPDSLDADQRWVFEKPMYAVLNIAVGDGWAGAPDAQTRWPATMVVDWFKWVPA